MTTPIDLDIFRAAQLLIDQHGDDAQLDAAQRADRTIEKGDVAGEIVWKRVLAAIIQLQRVKPSAGERTN